MIRKCDFIFLALYGGVCSWASGLLSPTVWGATAPSPGNVIGNPVWTALKLLVTLGLLIGLAVFSIRFLAKRTQFGGPSDGVQVISARQVGQGKSIQVVDVSGHRFLVGVGNDITLLATLENDALGEDSTEPSKVEPTFADALASRIASLRRSHEAADSDSATDNGGSTE